MNWSTGRRLLSQARKAPPLLSIDGAHHAAPFSTAASSPMTSVLSPLNEYGGTRRFTDAGEPWNTRPARSNFEPWQGQKKPPGQWP